MRDRLSPAEVDDTEDVDPICGICDEPRSAHVPDKSGPLAHPREARGEGIYVLVRPGYARAGSFPADDDIHMPPVYKFVPHARPRDQWDGKWRPSDSS